MARHSYKAQAMILKAIGLILFSIGIVAAYYGPLEIYVFYLFSESGPFYFDGFGVGSFWFGLLVGQNLAYYLLAGLLIPVGAGTLKLRRWALTLSRLYLWGWLAAGVLWIFNLVLFIPAIFRLGQPTINRYLIVIVFSILLLILLPAVLLRFYKSEWVTTVFEDADPRIYWTERYPFPLLATLYLFSFCIIALHLSAFFQVIFPLFGKLIFGRGSIRILAACIVILAALLYGVLRLRKWAWWGSLAFFSTLTISVVLTFGRYSFYQIVGMMDLPEYEVEFIGNLTLLHDFNLVGLLAIPLLAVLGLLVYSRKYFYGTGEVEIRDIA